MIRVRPPSVTTMSGGEIDGRAVLPEALKLVVGPLLLVLYVHDDVREVDQDPAAVALAFAAHRLDAELSKRVLDAVDDRTDLTVIGSGRQNEDICERELFTDVNGDDLAGQLVRGSCRDSLGEINSMLRGGHAVLLVIVLFSGCCSVGAVQWVRLGGCAQAGRPDLADRADAWRCTARRRRARDTTLVRRP